MTTRAQLASDLLEITSRSAYTTEPLYTVVLNLFEPRIYRTIRSREQVKTVGLSVSSRETDLPTDYLSQRSLTISGNDAKAEYYPPERFREREQYSGGGGAFGSDTIYTVEGNTLLMSPTPSATGENVTLVYVAGIPRLATGAQTNSLLQSNPDLYLWGGLWAIYTIDEDDVQAEKYGKLFGVVPGRDGRMNGALQNINRTEQRARFPRSSLRTIGSPHPIV